MATSEKHLRHNRAHPVVGLCTNPFSLLAIARQGQPPITTHCHACEGRHPLAVSDPMAKRPMDSRLRGNDKKWGGGVSLKTKDSDGL